MSTPKRRSAILATAVALLTACAGGSDERSAPTTPTTPTTGTAPTSVATTTAPPDQDDDRTIVATAEVDVVEVFEDPDDADPVRLLDRREETTGSLVFVVEQRADGPDGRHLVQLPVRPNGSTGWVRAADVSLTTHGYRIEVELGAHQLRLLDHDRVVLEAPIGVGTQDTPTPGGTYYVKELLRPPDPDGPYGTYAYGLSGFSNALDSFAGGDAVIGIHGTNTPEAVGTDVSSGCIRLTNDVMDRMVEDIGLPLGVPVDISA